MASQKPSSELQLGRWIDRLISAVRKRAEGELAEAEEQAEVASGYLRRAQYGDRNIMLAKFLRVCQKAGIYPGDVFAEVFPRTDCDPDFGMPTPMGPDPLVVRLARKRIENRDAETGDLPALDHTWLDRMDQLRYDNPREVISQAERAIAFVSFADIPRTLGIWASACRLCSRYDEALIALSFGLDMVREHGDKPAEIDLLQRASFVVASVSGNFWAALNLSERAAMLCIRSSSFTQLGRILVDQGIYLFSTDRMAESEAAFLRALELLDADERRHRVAALQGLGIFYRSQGNFEKALAYGKETASLVKDKFEKGKLHWLNGCTLTDLKRWDEAHQSFDQAMGYLVETSPVDAALSTCDHIRSLLACGKTEEAQHRAVAMRRLLEPVGENLIAAAAIRDLIRCEQEGQRLDDAFILRTVQRLERGRREIPHRP